MKSGPNKLKMKQYVYILFMVILGITVTFSVFSLDFGSDEYPEYGASADYDSDDTDSDDEPDDDESDEDADPGDSGDGTDGYDENDDDEYNGNEDDDKDDDELEDDELDEGDYVIVVGGNVGDVTPAVVFEIDGPLTLTAADLYLGMNTDAALLSDVTAVDGYGADISHLITVEDDGGFAEFVMNFFFEHVLLALMTPVFFRLQYHLSDL